MTTLSPSQLATLKTELQTDPQSLGYASHLAIGDDAGLAVLLNATSGPGAAAIALTSATRDEFLKAIRPAYLALPGLSSAVQAKWDRILQAINSGEGVTIDATTQALLGVAVSDGVLTQSQSDAAWHRTGSRAEVLLGAGTVLTVSDISAALRGN